MCRFVPVEYAPFDSPISAFLRDLRKLSYKRNPGAKSAIFFVDEEIFQEQQGLPKPRGIAAKEKCEADRPSFILSDQTFEWRRRAAHLRAQIAGRILHRIRFI